jgi:hypothetical protein
MPASPCKQLNSFRGEKLRSVHAHRAHAQEDIDGDFVRVSGMISKQSGTRCFYVRWPGLVQPVLSSICPASHDDSGFLVAV